MAKRNIKKALAKWGDEWILAGKGLLLAMHYPEFLITSGVVFVLFGTLMNLLAGGMSAFNLLLTVSFPAKLKILFDGFLGLFGVGKNFLDWLLVFVIAALQSFLVGLVVFIWKKRKKQQQINTDAAQNAGLAAGLAILGAGCPTCGTTLITPIIGAIFSSGSYAIAGVVSGTITIIAVIISLLTLKKTGLEAYVIIKSEKFMRGKNGHSGTDRTEA